MIMNTPVLVVGSYVQDLMFSTPRFPETGETLIGSFQSGPGGKGSNQAVAARRSGVATSYIGAIGDDAFGELAKAFHENENLISHWYVDKASRTGAASIVVDQKGQNQIVVAPGACEQLTENEVFSRFPESAQVVVTQLETHLGASMAAMKWGREQNALTVLNPAPMRDDVDLSILEFVDVIIPNESEFISLLRKIEPRRHAHLKVSHLNGMQGDEFHQMCREIGVPKVIVTLGEAGAFISEENGFEMLPALDSVQVVDTTGAGDAFVGGFAAGWVLFEKDLIKAVDYGIVVSGLSVQKVGTAPAMPHQQEIIGFLENES